MPPNSLSFRLPPARSSSQGAIAVIGLACRFPGADTAEEFWRLLSDGREAITFFSPEQLEAAGIDSPADRPARLRRR